MSQLNFSIGTFSQCMSFSPQNIKIDNFEDYTLYCIDCENVQQFDIKTLNATSPSVFFFFGNFEKSDPEILTNLFDKNELPRHQGNDHIRYDLEWNIKNYDSCRTRFAYTADPLFNIRRTTGHRKICNIRIDPKSNVIVGLRVHFVCFYIMR